MIDPAAGARTEDDLRELPLWLRVQFAGLARAPRLPPMAAPFAILITHAHWDHLSGAADWPAATIHLSQLELNWAHAITREDEYARGVLRAQLRRLAPQLAPFSSAAPLHDLLGDGSVMALALPGHTPGSAGYLVGDWLFVGDAVWERGSAKGPLGRSFDENKGESEWTLGTLRELQRARPGLRIVPAHDAKALEELPECKPAP